MSRSPFSFGTKVLAAAAGVLALFLVVGYLLPADWEAEATAHVDALPAVVFRFVDSPEGWREWTSWPESGIERSGPERGQGAQVSWNDPELGTGSFALTRVSEPERVEYRVEVGGSMLTEGAIALAVEGDGVRITWRERGDLGRNPLMGYWALFMDRAQSEELGKSLERLAVVAAATAGDRDGSPPDDPARSRRD
ncbi:MAG TPA: SRPBCC family protein [Longimicrobiales bacterium]|nr:SRPBCC family protein [Longimicrobiales bacterium]